MNRAVKIGIIILVLLLCVLAVDKGLVHMAKKSFPLKYEELINKYSAEFGLDRHFVMGVIFAESKFSPDAQSEAGAKGLMQMLDTTAEEVAGKLNMEYSEDMTLDPETSIKMGCYYLAYLKGMYENDKTVLAAYNAGIWTVRGWLMDKKYSKDGETLQEIPYLETALYVTRVDRIVGIYEKLY